MATKVRLTYTPEGGSKKSWEFDLENPPWDVTYAIEKQTGWAWGEFGDRLGHMSVIALRALLWTLRKRDEPKLDIDAVTVQFSEVDLDLIEDEDPDEDPKEP